MHVLCFTFCLSGPCGGSSIPRATFAVAPFVSSKHQIPAHHAAHLLSDACTEHNTTGWLTTYLLGNAIVLTEVSSAPPSSGTAAVVSQPIPTATEAGSGSGSGTSSGTSSRSPASTATSSAYISPPTGVRPASTDNGCPNINQTSYTPADANGDSVKVSSNSALIFRQLCEVNYPSGAEYGNPNLYDIFKVYVPNFRECMDLCAAYNQAYIGNLASGKMASGGYCRSVAMVKLPGEYCYLKNGTGETSKMDTQGHPKDFISAISPDVVISRSRMS
ncbi:hypothetical protein CGRA01v4_12848 [Colletotrichum graminicola]|uniref:WSC domain-containing protein n=1 Tax=Colletotrichum graminicola (strain M1.001 / M2 / FGSC 10212) TaxID=645133 RepID=E3QIW2_COLGM|nr:uncharacterized protein GLRG_05944 [Colletotrichum graminicola M1.001]EFQ30800.1 hypothetical protein GLRG_05944 [Colletotrichum graminicola M1.001]WDK21558.1 hypothetical protein CGRA01v4_12848 [Colletotrichum graminicola]